METTIGKMKKLPAANLQKVKFYAK